MRVFLDTNVFVSAFATRGICADLVREVMTNHELLVGEVVLKELDRVLAKKIKLPPAECAQISELLQSFKIIPLSKTRPKIQVRDPDDVWVLAAALDGQADYLVSGDPDLLSIAKKTGALKIVSPREFWEILRNMSY